MPRKWYLESPIDDTPDAPVKRYRVTGAAPLELDGMPVEPGEEFEAALKPLFESQMLGGGQIAVVGDDNPSPLMMTPFVPRTSSHVKVFHQGEE